MPTKLNGFVKKWGVIIAFALMVSYNTFVTHITMKNEVKHLGENVAKLEARVENLVDYLMKK